MKSLWQELNACKTISTLHNKFEFKNIPVVRTRELWNRITTLWFNVILFLYPVKNVISLSKNYFGLIFRNITRCFT